MASDDKKVIMVRSKNGGFPDWSLLHYKDGKFWLGGSCKVVVAKNSKHALELVKKALRQMKRFNLQYKTYSLIELKKSEGKE